MHRKRVFAQPSRNVDCGIQVHEECEVYLAALCGLCRKDAMRIARPFLEKSLLKGILPSSPNIAGEESWPQYKEEDFEKLHVVGKGNFGKVMLARHFTTGQLFALKIFKKNQVVENDEMESLLAEHKVLSLASREHCPFLLGSAGVFQNATRVFFVMEFIGGGDLMFHIQNTSFTEDQVRYHHRCFPAN